MKPLLRTTATGLILLTCLFTPGAGASAQSASPVAKLDPDRFIGTYYEIARYPIKREKACLASGMVLYALGDKKNSVQIVTSCEEKDGNSYSWNSAGKFSKSGDGKIKLAWIWPFTVKYWILNLAPDYTWALVGTPNHKSLSILSRTTTLSAEVLADIEAKASAQGFNTPKLIKITQHQP